MKTSADPDLWGHTRFGLDMLRTHRLPLVDPYSFTQDRPWVNHEWLSELQMGLAYFIGGVAGLAILKGLLALAAAFLAWSALQRSDFIVRVVTMGLVIVGTAPVTLTLRPQLWSLVLLAVLCRSLISDRPQARWGLPLLFGVWANLHGGWIVGFAVLGIWAAADVASSRHEVVEWAAVVALSAAATLCNPYGLTLWHFLLETVRLSRDITEWQPLWAQPIANWLTLTAAFVAVVFAIIKPHRYRYHAVSVLGVLAYASLRVSRVGPMFIMAATILLAPEIRRRWAGPDLGGAFHLPRIRLGAGALSIGFVVAAGWSAATAMRCITVQGDWVPPADALRLLESAPDGRLVTFFDWGEYAIWHLGPRIRISMDGRRETLYSQARLAEHDAILAGHPTGLAALEAWNAEYVWLPASSIATKDWLTTHGYRLDLDTPTSFVAVRQDLGGLPQPVETKITPRCYPH